MFSDFFLFLWFIARVPPNGRNTAGKKHPNKEERNRTGIKKITTTKKNK
jgi:hypothetical protein